MAEQKLRVGIIGANANRGWGSSAHIPALAALPEVELTAVCTAHADTAEAAKAKFGAKLAFHDYQAMVQHPDIDVVVVAVRVPFHRELTIPALQAGKHVYTEWPLGATLAEAQEMADLARAKGVKTMVGLQGRVTPGYLRLKEVLAEGYVGDVLAAHLTHFTAAGVERTSDRLWTKDRPAGVGMFTISFGHAIDAFTYCAGDFAEVSGVVSTLLPQWYVSDTKETVSVTTPDNVMITGRLKGGAQVTAHVATVPYHGPGLAGQIFGREGTITYTGSHTSEIKLMGMRKGDAGLTELEVPDRLRWVPANTPAGQPYSVAQNWRRFAEAIHTNGPVDPDFDAAVRLHQLLEAIQRASDTGQRQAVG